MEITRRKSTVVLSRLWAFQYSLKMTFHESDSSCADMYRTRHCCMLKFLYVYLCILKFACKRTIFTHQSLQSCDLLQSLRIKVRHAKALEKVSLTRFVGAQKHSRTLRTQNALGS